jgi:hypothetical protein
VCDPAGDACVVTPDPAQTPVGRVTVTAEAGNIVVVHPNPTSPRALVTLSNTEGVVTIDSLRLPAGFPARFATTSLAVVSLLPPGPPCRARTIGIHGHVHAGGVDKLCVGRIMSDGPF